MGPLVVYHAHCMDGAGAALAAWLKFGDEAEYRAVNPGDPAPTDEEVAGGDVYVLDFSYSRAETERLAGACGGYFACVDHHATAERELGDLPFCHFDMSKSGAMLAWDHFYDEARRQKACLKHKINGNFTRNDCVDCVVLSRRDPVPELFRYIQDRDLWTWQLPKSREVSSALEATGALEDFRRLIPVLEDWNVLRLALEGDAILRYRAQVVSRAVAAAEPILLGGDVRCLATNASALQSEIGEALAIESARRGLDPVGAVYRFNGSAMRWLVSLRSRDVDGETAPDVSEIARRLDPKGGGHPKSAGYSIDPGAWPIFTRALDVESAPSEEVHDAPTGPRDRGADE